MGLRLFLWLFAWMIVVFVVNTHIIQRATAKQWEETLRQSAQRTSETIKQATHYGMLLNKKEDVHHTIRRIARGPGVAGIRVYDKRGAIIFSSDKNEVGKRVDMKADGCVGCHDVKKPLQSVPASSRVRVYHDASGRRIMGLINPIENEAVCSSASCHAHPPAKSILGVLDVRLSMAGADQNIKEANRQTILAAAVMALIVGLITALFIYRMVRVPVRRLIQGTQRIANGDLDSHISMGHPDEIGELATAFNSMTDDLRKARQENKDWSMSLEQKVVDKADELSRAHQQIMHMEKMASLGKLAATVAHELNNPIAGILTYAKLVGRRTEGLPMDDEAREELARYIKMIQKESSRCGGIVRNLLLFTRRTGSSFLQNQLNEIIDRAMMLVQHRLAMSNISLVYEPLEGDDQLFCDADQVQQAIVALLINAVEAMETMEEGGTLTIDVTRTKAVAVIDISDTGPGIAPEMMPHLFEPFFSTKEETSGVGLGLSVVYGIVQRHCGNIEVIAKQDSGTTFQVTLPRLPRSQGEEECTNSDPQ